MSKLSRTCTGCGVTTQSEDPQKLGYVPPHKQHDFAEDLLCMRCFRMRHYNEILPVELQEADFLKGLSTIAQSKSLVVQLVDLFDFEGSLIPGIHRHIGNNPLFLFANKVDLFPKSTKLSKLKRWIETAARENGIFPVGVHLLSAAKGWYMDEAMEKIERFRDGRDVYVIGTANVGKSTLINQLLKLGDRITISRYPGTTLDNIRIPLPSGGAIIDTPGVLMRDRMSEWLTPQELKIVLPRHPLKPKIYQLQDQQTLFFGGLSRFDYVKGRKQPFVCYVSNQLLVHRTKRANADDILQNHLGKMLSPPRDPDRLPKWRKHQIVLSGKQKEDIVIAGLGFVRCGKEKGIVEVWAPEGIKVGIRSSII